MPIHKKTKNENTFNKLYFFENKSHINKLKLS